MATDGVKIIDGDTAHDTYWGLMDLYDSGASIDTIKNRIPFPQQDVYDDFDNEIYTTAYALAIWEIGYMTADVLQEVKRVIDKGVCVKEWTEDEGPKAGKARQKELDKLWNKISSENQKVRKVKKYKTVTNLLFEPGDVLAFQLKDKKYYATIVYKIDQYHGSCSYQFGKILYKDKKPPTIKDILKAEIVGSKIPSGSGMDLTGIFAMGIEEIMKQGGIDKLLKKEAKKTGSYVIGLDQTGVEHKDLIKFTDKFQKIGQVKIREAYMQTGSFGGASDFKDLTKDFLDLDDYIKIFKQDKLKISNLLDQ